MTKLILSIPMLKQLTTPENRRLLLKYVSITLLVFTAALAFQFSVILRSFNPLFIILPTILAITIGVVLGWNAILRRDLEKSNQAKSALISGVSHELRTPLTVINGFSRILSLDPALEDKHRDYAQKIYDNGEHLLQIINDLLDLSQINSGKMNVVLVPVNVQEELQAINTLMSEMAQQRRIRLQIEDVDARVCVMADVTRFHQVMINLISNAIKYSPEDSLVRVQVLLGGQQVTLEVIDQGPGIAADKLSQLFTPFNRLGADQGKVKGTGIGLAISKNLVEIMGGEIGARCPSGSGCRFWVRLPQGTSEST